MTQKTKDFLEKYNPENILLPVLEHYDSSSIRGGSFVTICPKMLADETIKKDLISKRGQEFYNNLMLLANNKTILYVSALKTIKPSSAYIAETPPNNFEEADLVIHKTPGLYSSPITVPTSILKTNTSSMFVHQQPLDDSLAQKNKITKSQTLDNEYNKGKQPKGTVLKGGNN